MTGYKKRNQVGTSYSAPWFGYFKAIVFVVIVLTAASCMSDLVNLAADVMERAN